MQTRYFVCHCQPLEHTSVNTVVTGKFSRIRDDPLNADMKVSHHLMPSRTAGVNTHGWPSLMDKLRQRFAGGIFSSRK